MYMCMSLLVVVEFLESVKLQPRRHGPRARASSNLLVITSNLLFKLNKIFRSTKRTTLADPVNS